MVIRMMIVVGGGWLPHPDCCVLLRGGKNSEGEKERKRVQGDTANRHVYHLLQRDRKHNVKVRREKDEEGGHRGEGGRHRYS